MTFLDRTSLTDKIDVALEVDSRVGYAFLLEDGVLVTDVWLFNCDFSPTESEWKVRSNPMPFRYSVDYCSNIKPILPLESRDWFRHPPWKRMCRLLQWRVMGKVVVRTSPWRMHLLLLAMAR